MQSGSGELAEGISEIEDRSAVCSVPLLLMLEMLNLVLSIHPNHLPPSTTKESFQSRAFAAGLRKTTSNDYEEAPLKPSSVDYWSTMQETGAVRRLYEINSPCKL